MNDTIIKFRQLCMIPTVCRSHQITRNPLKPVYLFATAMRTGIESGRSIFIAALHTAVTIMVYRSVTDIIFIHHIDNSHNCFRIMCSIPRFLKEGGTLILSGIIESKLTDVICA